MADSLTTDENKVEIAISSDELRYGPQEEVERDAEQFAKDNNLDEALFIKAAMLIKLTDPKQVPNIQRDEIKILEKERKSPLKAQKKLLYFTILLNSIAAAVQGWDETGTNGANLTWPESLGIHLGKCLRQKNEDTLSGNATSDCKGALWLIGFVNAMPYIIITLIGWWLSDPLNHFLGRRVTIFIAAIFSLLAPIGSGFVRGWRELLVCRAILGIGMGLKEVTVPIYTAELAPSESRGKLVMSWQIWTTVGIFCGAAANLICNTIHHGKDRIWRYELGSAFIPAVPLLLGVFFCPESPRWLYKRNRIGDAYKSLEKIRKHKIQAARDLYYIHIHWQHRNRESISMRESIRRFRDLFRRPAIRRATVAASILMASQQLCGINIFAFYSSTVYDTNATDPNLENHPFSHDEPYQRLQIHRALSFTMGYATVQFAVGLLAIAAIDKLGRRFLLLLTIPAMSAFLLIAGQTFRIKNPELPIRKDTTLAFILLFAAAYAPGMGPIPFTYSAEVFPLTHREIGMGWAVAINNFWGSLLALTFPKIFKSFKPDGAFAFFAGLSLLAFSLIFLFVPETKRMPLELLDHFFGWDHFTRKYVEYNIFTLGRYYYRKLSGMAEEDEKKPEFPPDLEEHEHIE